MRLSKLIVAFSVLTASCFSVSAQTAQNIESTSVPVGPLGVSSSASIPFTPKKSPISVATVNIYNATSTQKGNTVTVSFDITNRVGIQPGVKYGLFITKTTSKGQTVADEHIYDEVLSLGENSSVHKVLEYQAPSFLDGDYKLFISSKNVNDFPFGTAFAGTITFKKTEDQILNIQPSSCFLTIEGEKSNKKYTPTQGVDISTAERLLSNCVVENTSDSPVTVTPNFVTRSQSIFGDVVIATGGDTSEVTILPHEKKTIVTKLPKAKTPQVYTVSMQYGTIGNDVSYTYILQGPSGTIYNIVLNKDIYKKTEVAKGSFMWTASAGNFTNSRNSADIQLGTLSAEVIFTDQDGNQCAPTNTYVISNGEFLQKLETKITSDCVRPQVDITLTDEKLGQLAHSSFQTGKKVLVQNRTGSAIFNEINILSAVFLFLFLAIICTICLLGYDKWKSSRAPVTPLLVILFCTLLFSGVGKAKADTFYSGTAYALTTVNLDKPTYTAGETMTISGSMQMLLPYGGEWYNAYLYWSKDTSVWNNGVSMITDPPLPTTNVLMGNVPIESNQTLPFSYATTIAPSAGAHFIEFFSMISWLWWGTPQYLWNLYLIYYAVDCTYAWGSKQSVADAGYQGWNNPADPNACTGTAVNETGPLACTADSNRTSNWSITGAVITCGTVYPEIYNYKCLCRSTTPPPIDVWFSP
jgi:hypothetical protein